MGSLCPSKVDTRWADSSPYSLSILNHKPFTCHSSLLPQNKNLFSQVYDVDKRKLGFGHYGDVKKCIHKETGVIRAVKIYNKERTGSLSLNHSWFFRQIEVLSKISHPCLVKIHEFFEDRDNFFLVMDYHRGGDLLQKLRSSRRLPCPMILQIMRQILIGVSYLHTLRIVHRDLKPENILVWEKEGEVLIKITDFDTAGILMENGKTSGTLGTAYYMAPELLEKEYDEKCDMWSVGIIMYSLFTGHLPYTGMSDHQIISNIQNIRIDFDNPELSRVPEKAKDLLRRLLCKDPRKRISAPNALAHLWFVEEQRELGKTREVLEKVQSADLRMHSMREFIITHFAVPSDNYKLDLAFLDIDTDNNGLLTLQEVSSFFRNFYTENEAWEKGMSFIEKIEGSCEDLFTYEEFIRSAIDLRKILSEKRIKKYLDTIVGGTGEKTGNSHREMYESVKTDCEIEDWMIELKSKMNQVTTPSDIQQIFFRKLNQE